MNIKVSREQHFTTPLKNMKIMRNKRESAGFEPTSPDFSGVIPSNLLSHKSI